MIFFLQRSLFHVLNQNDVYLTSPNQGNLHLIDIMLGLNKLRFKNIKKRDEFVSSVV
jgi:hypothetical protein